MVTRKLIQFDDETWRALDLYARDSMRSLQEIADEAIADFLAKHNRRSV
jgi:predicted transcriptional regulator